MTTKKSTTPPNLGSGRERLSFEDFLNRFGPDSHTDPQSDRHRIWDQFLKATKKLQETLPVVAAWIGGSYITGIRNPSDLDVVYIIGSADYARLDHEGKARVGLYAKSGGLMDRGIKVDSHIMHWEVFPELDYENPAQFNYLKQRGYWDDFLQRHTDDKHAPLTNESAVPRRGFLEVILDGYNV